VLVFGKEVTMNEEEGATLSLLLLKINNHTLLIKMMIYATVS